MNIVLVWWTHWTLHYSKRRREGPNFTIFCKVTLLNSHFPYAWMGLCNLQIGGNNCFKENSHKEHIQPHKVLKSTWSETSMCQNFSQPTCVNKSFTPWNIRHSAGVSREVHFLMTWLIGLYHLQFDWPSLTGSAQVQGNIWSVWGKNPKNNFSG